MCNKIKNLIFVLGIIFLIIGIWLTAWNNIRTAQLDTREESIIIAEDYWSNSMVMFRYNAMKLKIKRLEEDLKSLEHDNVLLIEEALAGKLAVKHSENIVALLADYIVFLQQLCDANGLIYPSLVVGE